MCKFLKSTRGTEIAKLSKFKVKKDIACEEYVQDVLDFKYNSKSGNPTLVSNPSLSKETKSEFCKEPIVKSSSPTLTPFGESDFLLEEIEDFLKDESIPMKIEDSYYDPKGDILYLKKLLNDDPSQLPLIDLKQAKETKAKSSIEEPSKVELKELPSHLEYAFLEETDKLPMIIEKDLKDDEKEALLKEYLENSSDAITPVLPTKEPEYSLSMGYKHLSTIPEIESDEVIKSSAKNLVQFPSEYEVTSNDESECDVPVKDESSPIFTTFSN
nr:reverse transcriptase domain-containing protein [Tanacetum cinerariifolium]